MSDVESPDEPSAFDGVADDYEVARPGYPAEIFDAIEQYGGFNEPPRVVEVGAGTGQATRQMATRGWTVHGIEPGPRLAAAARSHVPSPNTQFHVTRFEDADLAESSFDLVAAATSWHWVEADIGYRKAHSLLKPSGTIALFWNAHVPHTTHPAWEPIRNAYLDVAPELADLAPLTPDRPDYDPGVEIRKSGCFDAIERHVFAFDVAYPIDRFLRLIDTYASHRALDQQRRALLHERLQIAADGQLSGTVTKPYETLLVLGRRP
jgi:SAM-dependent methyltransferase